MWAWLYVALGAVAMALTWGFAIREEAIVFTASMSTIIWALLALTSEITVVDGGGQVAVAVGPARWIFAGLGLLSMIALIGSVLGVYPTEGHPDSKHTQVQQ